MSQDPTGYGTDPQNPYGAQNPNNAPQPNPSGNPYGAPLQNPYDNPYGAPPQNPYAGAGYAPPQGGQLPLNEAVKQLPNQYIKAITKPSVATFAEELPKAGWDITWIQILIYTVGSVVIGLITAITATASTAVMTTALTKMMGLPSGPSASSTLPGLVGGIGGAFEQIVAVPAGFFIVVSVQYLLAKAFKGEGTYLAQAYSTLLFQVPIALGSGLIAAVLSFIPIAGAFIAAPIGFLLGIYGIVLNVFQIQASHRLTGGKATAVVLIPIVALILIGFLCAIVIIALVAAAMKGATHP